MSSKVILASLVLALAGYTSVALASEDEYAEPGIHSEIEQNMDMQRTSHKHVPGQPPRDLMDYPASVRPLLVKASAFTDANQFSQALSCYEQAIRMQPKCWGLYRRRLVTYVRLQDYDKAIADANLVLAKDPANPKTINVLRFRARCYALKGDKAKALADFNKLIAADPANYRAFEDRAVLYTQLGKTKEAAADRQTAMIAATPMKVQELLAQGKFNEALTTINATLKLDPKNEKLAVTKAQILISLGKYDDAIRQCDDSARGGRGSTDICRMRGKAYEAQGKMDYAIAEYTFALNKFKEVHNQGKLIASDEHTLAGVLHDRTRAYIRARKYDAAIRDGQASVAVLPDPETNSLLGDALAMKGDYKQALVCYKRALAGDAKMEHALVESSAVASKIKAWPDAIRASTALINLHPKVSDCYLTRAKVYEQSGDYADAEKDLNTAIKIQPDDELGYATRARVRGELNNVDGAIQDYSAAIKLAPGQAGMLLNRRADLYQRQGKSALAAADRKAANQKSGH